MKVLFAVNNDKISEAVIKKYPKDYKELLSYKNVYYFNAILKEIQNDKSYDRIVISEDLEPFVNTNHDSIDNFIFSNLDKISDEAQGIDGKEISIILICSERRNFGSNILNKLFSIGIYNALIGNDRSMDNLCKLINRPRTKKEAKVYYRIDQATYESAVNNGEVSETEIQNILNHFRKLGKSTERYTDSFNNIAAQYTDDQLRLIVNVLPIKVKAVLEAECEKYQTLMGTEGDARSQVGKREPGISVNTIGSGKETNINGPIVIPSGVKRYTPAQGQPAGVIPKKVVPTPMQANVVASEVRPQQANGVANGVRQQSQDSILGQRNVQSGNIIPTPVSKVGANQAPVNKVPANQNVANQVPVNHATVNQAPVSQTVEPERNKATGQHYTGTIAQVKRTLIARMKNAPTTSQPDTYQQVTIPSSASQSSIVQPQSVVAQEEQELDAVLQDMKRGRGRPKKPITEQEIKPKGKRGRPRKVVVGEENSLDDLLGGIGEASSEEDIMMPGLEDEAEESVLPGLEDNVDESVLPGLEDDAEEDTLPGLEDDTEEGVLPGVEDDIEESEESDGEEVDVNSLLAGLDEDDTVNNNSNTANDGTLPGLDNAFEGDAEESVLPGLDEDMESSDTTADDSGTLPGLDNNYEEETVLPGMGFEETDAIESIKPQINYSMSNLNSLLSKDKKIVSFVGATKNGTSFLINNLALMFSMMGVDTAILDMTQNKNSYYLFTDSREELRKIAYTSLSKLENGYAEGIKFNKNLTVYTGLPSDTTVYENAEPILSTLVQNHSLVLIDTDFSTPPAYFASSQEIYLVQSMDILTIQPLTSFLRELKFKGAWEPEKARVVINKEVPIRILSNKTIIGGMSRYNGPDMSVMTDLFNKDMVKACSIPFDEKVYAKYLETLATCKLSISSLPKQFRAKLQILGEMVYPRLNSKTSYSPSPTGGMNYNQPVNNFSSETNGTLNKMKSKF